MKNNRSAYATALSRGLINKICSHMDILWERKWDKENLTKEALKYKNVKDFYTNSKGAYLSARRAGFLSEICHHMKKNKRNNWTKGEIVKEALKYSHRKHFSEQSSGAYNAALRLKILDDVCSHMTPLTNLTVRALYAFEHSDNTVYVGLTWNYKQRYQNHMKKNKTLIEKKHLNQKFIEFNEWYPAKEASVKEQELVEKYRNNGWVILNKAKPGSLGGRRVFWTPEKIQEEALKYNIKRDFDKAPNGAAQAARRCGIFEKVCAHMVNGGQK